MCAASKLLANTMFSYKGYGLSMARPARSLNLTCLCCKNGLSLSSFAWILTASSPRAANRSGRDCTLLPSVSRGCG